MPTPTPNFTGNALLIYQDVFEVCESYRRKDEQGDSTSGFGFGEVPLTILMRIMEKLIKSVNRWTKLNGIRGYVNFVAQHV